MVDGHLEFVIKIVVVGRSASIGLHKVRRLQDLLPSITCIDFQVKKSLEWLQGERVENHRLAAVLILKVSKLFSCLLLIHPNVPNVELC